MNISDWIALGAFLVSAVAAIFAGMSWRASDKSASAAIRSAKAAEDSVDHAKQDMENRQNETYQRRVDELFDSLRSEMMKNGSRSLLSLRRILMSEKERLPLKFRQQLAQKIFEIACRDQDYKDKLRTDLENHRLI